MKEEQPLTKSERRELKKENNRKMKVSNRGFGEIVANAIMKRANKVR